MIAAIIPDPTPPRSSVLYSANAFGRASLLDMVGMVGRVVKTFQLLTGARGDAVKSPLVSKHPSVIEMPDDAVEVSG